MWGIQLYQFLLLVVSRIAMNSSRSQTLFC